MSEQMLPNEVIPVREVDDQSVFSADMAYLRGMAAAIFEHATPQALMRIAAIDPPFPGVFDGLGKGGPW